MINTSKINTVFRFFDLLSKTANESKSKERLFFALGIKTIEFEKLGEFCEIFLRVCVRYIQINLLVNPSMETARRFFDRATNLHQ